MFSVEGSTPIPLNFDTIVSGASSAAKIPFPEAEIALAVAISSSLKCFLPTLTGFACTEFYPYTKTWSSAIARELLNKLQYWNPLMNCEG